MLWRIKPTQRLRSIPAPARAASLPVRDSTGLVSVGLILTGYCDGGAQSFYTRERNVASYRACWRDTRGVLNVGQHLCTRRSRHARHPGDSRRDRTPFVEAPVVRIHRSLIVNLAHVRTIERLPN